MSGWKSKLIFDPTDATSISESDQVGAHITDGTDNLDINTDGSLNAQITDGTDTLAINGDGSINAVVTATDLDIRDLINTQDSIAVGDETSIVDMATMDSAFGLTSVGFPIMGVRQDAGGSPVSATGDSHPLVFNDDGELKVAADLTSSIADDAADSGNPIKIGGRGVSGALTALSATNDRYDLLGDLYRRTWINDSPNIGSLLSDETVGTTSAELVSSALGGRRTIMLENASARTVYLGNAGTITTSGATRGWTLHKGEKIEMKWGEDLPIFAIGPAVSLQLKVWEIA